MVENLKSPSHVRDSKSESLLLAGLGQGPGVGLAGGGGPSRGGGTVVPASGSFGPGECAGFVGADRVVTSESESGPGVLGPGHLAKAA